MSDSKGEGERLHKVLAHAGLASRRKCEDLIRSGRVRVNGEVVREMGVKVDLAKDEVSVDNERIKSEHMVYLLVYKPLGVICTTDDQWGRKTILDLVPAHRRLRLFTVGRLEIDSEGLVIVTNDGDFAHEVLLPKRRLPRTYWVKVQGTITPEVIARAREGVWLSDGRTPPMDIHVLRAGREVSTAKCTVIERHHHQLKRIWARLGTPVQRMVLVRIATIGTEDLKKGTSRPLTRDEVELLRNGPPGEVRIRPPKRRSREAASPETETEGEPQGPVGWGTPAAAGDAPKRRERPSRPFRSGGPPRSDRPARSGGRPRSDRPVRSGGPPRSDRPVRSGGRPRSDRPVRSGGPPRSDRPARSGGPRSDRPARPGGPPRSHGPERKPRGQRPSRDWGDRPPPPSSSSGRVFRKRGR
jgi:23S rRNA pseudouridine2605 synthase